MLDIEFIVCCRHYRLERHWTPPYWEQACSSTGPRGCPEVKFGLFTIVPWRESLTQERALNEALEQRELADQLGLDEVWLGEHRFSRQGLLSGIWSFLGQVAARTKRARSGTPVLVLPL